MRTGTFKKALVAFSVLVVTAIAIFLIVFLLELRPWVPAGTAVRLGTWQFGDCEFQVWQRKNQSTFEPFADGLFVRRGTNAWSAFCFDIQDTYSPRMELRKEAEAVSIIEDGKKVATFDLTSQTFRTAANNTAVMSAENIPGQPPGQWWLNN